MRTRYDEFESLEHLLSTRLLPGGDTRPLRFVVFGGTGAVGGAVVLELCKLSLMARRHRGVPLRCEIYATGSTEKEIAKLASRLYLALEGQTEIEKVEPRRHYRVGQHLDLRFSLLSIHLPRDIEEVVVTMRRERGESFELEGALDDYFQGLPQPFLRFIEDLGTEEIHAAIVAIPLPSVATYTLEKVDSLVSAEGLDHQARQRIKSSYLRRFINGLAVVQQRYARAVVMAHTTAVGGMYRVDGGKSEIRLGFAHSALGKKLVDKKFFADELTQLYIDQGFDVLVTAAAIGIDSIALHCHLPLDRAVQAAFSEAANRLPKAPKKRALPKQPVIQLYRSIALPLEDEAEDSPLDFGNGKELIVEAAIRSGENGLFSVANCVALYNVMKVAIPEELAIVLVRYSVFGRERRRDWFRDQVCYYSETENSLFALRLLDNYPQLTRAHLGAFAIQAYQALGSATHQARLHELGLVSLLLRIRDLGRRFEQTSEEVLTKAISDLDGFFWEHTALPSFDDLETLSAQRLAELLGQLCEVDSMESAGRLLGYDPRQHGRREPGRERFLARLSTAIKRYLCSITSLGIPIAYRSPRHGDDRVLSGIYVAPIEKILTARSDLQSSWNALAEEHGIPVEVARNWVIVNNGFVDLRPHALVSTATDSGPHLTDTVHVLSSTEELADLLASLPVGAYFTTCGTVAFKFRLGRLFARLKNRRIELGTLETWKHLFQQDPQGRFVMTPGLVETVRMYSEGLGKVTGTGVLWPEWGY